MSARPLSFLKRHESRAFGIIGRMADDSQGHEGASPTASAAFAASSAAPVVTAVDNDNDNDNDNDLAVDEREVDSAYGGDDSWHSDTTSLASAIVRGHIENGRKYQTMREDKYWGPSDEKQFDTMELGHLLYMILDSQQINPLFHAPMGDNPQNILDLGTGDGTWAIEVADKYPSANVYGIDLYPPPAVWVPPNCQFQVDDMTQPWTFRQQFDLIHMRLLLGAFTPEESSTVYQSCYDNLAPGGWIEEVELDVRVMCDDNSIPPDSVLSHWGPNFLGCAERAGRPLNTQLTMKQSIEKAGFVDVQEKLYKCPIGGWPKNKLYKDAGRVNKEHWKAGLEGWAMWLLTKHGEPHPWSPEEVQVYVATMRNAINDPSVHTYHFTRRVWGRKPLGA